MPNNVALPLVERMIREGHSSQWFMEQFQAIKVIDHFKDLVFSLQESIEEDYPQPVREKMLEVAIPSMQDALSRMSLQAKKGINIRMSNAFFVVANGAQSGHRKAGGYSNAAFKCLDAAETADEPYELIEQARVCFGLAFANDLDKGSLDWQITLIGSGDCEIRIAPYTDDPANCYRRGIRFLIRSREEGMKKWNGNWTTALAMQAKAHRALAKLGENTEQNDTLAEFLEHRALTELEMPAPIRPESFMQS